MSLAFEWRERARWLADARVDMADVASQYATSIVPMPAVLRIPLMPGLSDPSKRAMVDLNGNMFVPASFLEFVYAPCNQSAALALPSRSVYRNNHGPWKPLRHGDVVSRLANMHVAAHVVAAQVARGAEEVRIRRWDSGPVDIL